MLGIISDAEQFLDRQRKR